MSYFQLAIQVGKSMNAKFYRKKNLENMSNSTRNVDRRQTSVVFICYNIIEPVHEVSSNAVCATSKASDQPAHTRSLIRAFASRLSFL